MARKSANKLATTRFARDLNYSVDKFYFYVKIIGLQKYRGVEQSVARQAHNLEVVGSSPSSATIVRKIQDLMVQKTSIL